MARPHDLWPLGAAALAIVATAILARRTHRWLTSYCDMLDRCMDEH